MKTCIKCSNEGIDTLYYGDKEKKIKGIDLTYRGIYFPTQI